MPEPTDAELLLTWFDFPAEGTVFTGRPRTTPYPTQSNDPLRFNLMNWNLLFSARDMAWKRTQGAVGTYLQCDFPGWLVSYEARPDQTPPPPQPPRAFVAKTMWVERIDGDGNVETDGNGRPMKMFECFDIVQGNQPACAMPQY